MSYMTDYIEKHYKNPTTRQVLLSLFQDDNTNKKTPLDQAYNSALTTSKKALLGNIISTPQYKLLADKGILPDVENKNVFGTISSALNFPLQKAFGALSTFPRVESAIATEAYKAGVNSGQFPKVSEFKWNQYKPQVVNPFKILGNIDKEGWKNIGYSFNNAEEYANTGFTDLYNKMFAGTKATNKFKWTEDTNDWKKGTNWIQKLGSGLIGSPTAVAGLGSDILFDPLTYLSGGVGKGAKTGIKLTEDIIDEAGKTILPKGSQLALTKAGRKLAQDFIDKTVTEEMIIAYAKNMGISSIKTAESQLGKDIIEQVIRESVSKGNIGNAYKLIDFGGLKFAGQTAIPGYKMAGLGDSLTNLTSKNKFFDTINKALNPNYGIPQEFRPIKGTVDSTMKVEFGKLLQKADDAVTDLSRTERDTLNKYSLIQRDIAKTTGKLDDTFNKIDKLSMPAEGQLFASGSQGRITRLQNLAKGYSDQIIKYEDIIRKFNVTPKIETAYDKLQNIFRGLYNTETSTLGEDAYKKLGSYFPGRYVKGNDIPIKQSLLGAAEAPFQKGQKLTWLQAQKLGYTPKSLEDVLGQRFAESTRLLGRNQFLDEVKQFGVMGAKDGYTEITDTVGKVLPELKGFTFPKEFENAFKNSYNTFFGDNATKNITKAFDDMQNIWKRWALATPGYHLRNFQSDGFSGLMEYGLDYFNPRRWKKAFDTVVMGKPLEITSDIGKKIELTPEQLAKLGTFDAQNMVEGVMGKGTLSKASKFGVAAGKIGKTLDKFNPASLSLTFGSKREALGRTVGMIIELEHGSPLVEAAWNIKKVFFDYNALTQFERNVLKRVIPFYTWMRKNLARQFELMGTKTGKYAVIPKLSNYLNQSAGLTEEEKAFMPDYYKDLNFIKTGMKDSADNPLFYNPNLPFQDISKLGFNDFMTQLSPLIKIPIELATNKDLFFKSDIDRGRMQQQGKWLSNTLGKLPQALLNAIGAKKDEQGNLLLTDKQSYMLRQFPAFYNMTRMSPANETPKTAYDILSILAGIKFTPFDLNKEKTSKYKTYKSQLDDLIANYNQMNESNPLPDMNTKTAKQQFLDLMEKYKGGI